jgi:hypothetical protein
MLLITGAICGRVPTKITFFAFLNATRAFSSSSTV